MTTMKCLLVLTILFTCCLSFEDADFWQRLGQEEIRRRLNLRLNNNVAKNVVLMIGDGLGLSTIMAARVLRGQLHNKTGEETVLNMERLPHLGLSKVYSVDNQVPDSAATATAMMTGIKTNSKVINLDSTAPVGTCSSDNKPLSTMLHWSQKKGKHTGIVTTARITHATPAAAYASTPNRKWEHDHEVEAPCDDIASQLVYNNSDIRVILGGGRDMFLPNNQVDPADGTWDWRKRRRDDRNLIRDWMDDKVNRGVNHSYVWTSGHLHDVDLNTTDYLLGLFSPSHMQYELDRLQGPSGEPSLAEMTETAIRLLQKNDEGFFLMVEGARIDHAHHETNAKRALHDTLAFDDAVEVAVRLTDDSDTLLIVTADHSHTMTVAGYSVRGNGILDIARPTEDNHGRDELPYTTLSYANGPRHDRPRKNLTDVDTARDRFQQEATVPMDYETHSGEDVPVYSRGPMAHLLSGVMEQNVIAYVMAHAACVGDVGLSCETGRQKTSKYEADVKNKEPISANKRNNAGSLKNVSVYMCMLSYLVILLTSYFTVYVV